LKHGYPHLEGHRTLHAAFFENLERLDDDLRVFGPSQHLADRALEVAQDWLIDHIADEDMQYGNYVRRQPGSPSKTDQGQSS
jgi:hemerythrin